MKITFENISKRFHTLRGKVDALRDLHLNIRDGEFFVLLGPSGCGKSTTLNLVAGLEAPTQGVLRFNDQPVADPGQGIMVPPRRRNVSMVFQSYALYPHMKVFDNIAFPLKIAGQEKGLIQRSVENIAESLGIASLMDRKPGELSGGQRQRVAIARALVRNPDVFLLDEPLSNLDTQLRTSTRGELKRLQQEMAITTLYVTHDQTEAMTLGDRIALFAQGRLIQCGTPKEMYDHPQTPFVATFIGSPPMNLISVDIRDTDRGPTILLEDLEFPLPRHVRPLLDGLSGNSALLGIRPEHVHIATENADNAISGRIRTVELLGRETIYHVSTSKNRFLVLSDTQAHPAGQNVRLTFSLDHLHLFDSRKTDGL